MWVLCRPVWASEACQLFLVPSRSTSTPLYPSKCYELKNVPQFLLLSLFSTLTPIWVFQGVGSASICFPIKLGPFLRESSLFIEKFAFFLKELLILFRKLLSRNIICSLKKLIPCSRRHMVTLEEQLKPLAPLGTWLFLYPLIPRSNLCPLLPWEHGSWRTLFFSKKFFWASNLKVLPKDKCFSSILFVNEK